MATSGDFNLAIDSSGLDGAGQPAARRHLGAVMTIAVSSPTQATAHAQAEQVSQAPLAPREVQVLERISHGLTSRQISRQLGITPSTVETYVSRLREKLNAPTRAQLVRAAVALGM